jgi:TetR/AcrR family transcriptional repressor of nem operon
MRAEMKDGKPAKKQQTRERIIGAAAKLFLQNGYHATGVDKVMSEANLTAGGFYSHFSSKDDLLTEAFALACQGLDERLPEDCAHSGSTFIETYLSTSHRDDASSGCPFPALGPELSRAPEPVRSRAAEGLDSVINKLQAKGGMDRTQATVVFALCVGGMVLSRLAATVQESDRVLEDCRHAAHDIGSSKIA